MVNGNEVSMWVAGARRRMTVAQIVAHATAQAAMDVDGREFWAAVRAVVERTK